MRIKKIKEALFWPNIKDCFTQWGVYLTLAIPATFMICFEWWSFEILFIISGLLGVDALAANVILMNIMLVGYMMPLGISEALNTLVGNCIGGN